VVAETVDENDASFDGDDSGVMVFILVGEEIAVAVLINEFVLSNEIVLETLLSVLVAIPDGERVLDEAADKDGAGLAEHHVAGKSPALLGITAAAQSGVRTTAPFAPATLLPPMPTPLG